MVTLGFCFSQTHRVSRQKSDCHSQTFLDDLQICDLPEEDLKVEFANNFLFSSKKTMGSDRVEQERTLEHSVA